MGFPIRISPDHRLYTAPRDFSQCPTSFFGTWRLGIHRKPLVAYSVIRRIRNSFAFFTSFLLLRLTSVVQVLPQFLIREVVLASLSYDFTLAQDIPPAKVAILRTLHAPTNRRAQCTVR